MSNRKSKGKGRVTPLPPMRFEDWIRTYITHERLQRDEKCLVNPPYLLEKVIWTDRQLIAEDKKLYCSLITLVNEGGEPGRKLETIKNSPKEMSVGEKLKKLQVRIEKIEHQKDALIYELYGLTAEEIRQIEVNC